MPFSSFQVQLALTVDLEQPGALRILPARWVWVVAARTGLPAAGGDLHGQSLVGTEGVVLPAIVVEPELGACGQRSAPGGGPVRAPREGLPPAFGLGWGG